MIFNLNTEALEKTVKMLMEFRETPNYKKHFERIGEAIKAYYEGQDECDGLEELMLASFSLMRFIRKSFPSLISSASNDKPWEVRPLKTALMTALEILDEPNDTGIPLPIEANALEALSLAAYRVLKERKEIVPPKPKVEVSAKPYNNVIKLSDLTLTQAHATHNAMTDVRNSLYGPDWKQRVAEFTKRPSMFMDGIDDGKGGKMPYCSGCGGWLSKPCTVHKK